MKIIIAKDSCERRISQRWHSESDREDVVEVEVEKMQLQKSCESLEKDSRDGEMGFYSKGDEG